MSLWGVSSSHQGKYNNSCIVNQWVIVMGPWEITTSQDYSELRIMSVLRRWLGFNQSHSTYFYVCLKKERVHRPDRLSSWVRSEGWVVRFTRYWENLSTGRAEPISVDCGGVSEPSVELVLYISTVKERQCFFFPAKQGPSSSEIHLM